MTRRERLERKIERRQDWAANRRRQANAVFTRNEPFTRDIAFNTQPGHIPLRARIIRQEDRAFQSLQVADHHDSKAAGLQAQLDRSIYSDDSDAIVALEERIAEREAERERMVLVNKLWRKQDAPALADLGINLESLNQKLKDAGAYFGKQPHMPYELSNLGGRITADKKRLEVLKAQHDRAAKAEESPNGVTLEQCSSGYVRVTFAEKPEREVLNALKAAGFWWSKGSWSGQGEKLPQMVKDLLAAPC